MSEEKYTQDQVDALEKKYPFLAEEASKKYDKYKSKDPFPMVGEALLNSVDLLMYLLTVGVVEPFHVNNLKGVTYQCSFSGEAHRFNTEVGGMETIHLNKNDELKLEPNSITYLKIRETFHVPEYMVLRFNLSVSNAYKGLLLGTGPIVDPGFEGNLFIPLHNLTGNHYIIKKDAPLIRVEFTKLSRHVDWKNKKKDLFPPLKPITKKTPHNAGFSVFFEDALLDPDKRKFYNSKNVISVRSSIPEAIRSSAKKADDAQKSAKDAVKKADDAQKSAKSVADTTRNWSIIGGLGVVVTVAGLIIAGYALLQDANSRYDSIVQEVKDCNYQINRLNQQIIELQEEIGQYEATQPPCPEQLPEENVYKVNADIASPSSEETRNNPGEDSDSSH